MVALFVSFGAKSLTGGGKFIHNIFSKLSLSEQTFFFRLVQTPQFEYFSGLLPCPLEENLTKVCQGPLDPRP